VGDEGAGANLLLDNYQVFPLHLPRPAGPRASLPGREERPLQDPLRPPKAGCSIRQQGRHLNMVPGPGRPLLKAYWQPCLPSFLVVNLTHQ
jgi:hypothetical protein